METKISASLLACDLSDITGEIRRCEQAGVDLVHFDVMDGQFVEQITYGAPVLKRVRRKTKMPLDVHLMVKTPEKQLGFFADAGADIITVHAESDGDAAECLVKIRELGIKSSLALKPDTPIETAFELLALCDMVLVMTVEPGYGGQELIEEMLPKISALREYADGHGFSALDIEADGGINSRTSKRVIEAGANVLVSGTSLFKMKTIDEMRGKCALLKGK